MKCFINFNNNICKYSNTEYNGFPMCCNYCFNSLTTTFNGECEVCSCYLIKCDNVEFKAGVFSTAGCCLFIIPFLCFFPYCYCSKCDDCLFCQPNCFCCKKEPPPPYIEGMSI